MHSLFVLLCIASLVLFFIGLFTPKKSLFWYKKERTKSASALIYGVLIILFLLLLVLGFVKMILMFIVMGILGVLIGLFVGAFSKKDSLKQTISKTSTAEQCSRSISFVTDVTERKWYKKRRFLIPLVLFVPPIGIYAVFKSNFKALNKALLFLVGVFTGLVFLIVMVGSRFSYYDSGMNYYENGNLSTAREEFTKVPISDEHYKESQNKIIVIERKLSEQQDSMIANSTKADNLKKQLEQEINKFQKRWADSIVKSYEGDYIVGNKLSPAHDTIYFQLSKIATAEGDANIDDLNRAIHQKEYDSLLALNFNDEVYLPKTIIVLAPDAEQQKENIAKAERRDKINRQFSIWDGSHRNLTRYIKQKMNDPDSYEHIQTTWLDKKNYILVQTECRGKNAFGAKIINVVTAKVDLDGNILQISW